MVGYDFDRGWPTTKIHVHTTHENFLPIRAVINFRGFAFRAKTIQIKLYVTRVLVSDVASRSSHSNEP